MNSSNNPPTGEDVRERIEHLFTRQREHRFQVAATTAAQRRQKLQRLLDWIQLNQERIRAALQADFAKPPAEVDLTEIFPVTTEIKHARRRLKHWMRPRRVRRTVTMATSRSWIQYEPRGVALIISPWNFPFNLTLVPLVSALAAGNCMILKPSEFSAHTSRLISALVGELFPEDEVAVVKGDKTVAQTLLEQPFDHIFFTGSPEKGKLVMSAAARNLSSVTLELGGKSPVIVDGTAHLADAVKKVAWTKFINNGQTCIAPDYVLVEESHYRDFVNALVATLREFYGEETGWETNPDYCRLISTHHLGRLKTMLDESVALGARVECGGKAVVDQRYLAPTVLSDVPWEAPLMQEEIFGPLLPVLPFKTLDEAIGLVNSKPKPLALYIFSRDSAVIRKVLAGTSAGGTCINDVAVHFYQSNLPFGGVNNSGFGSCHGFYGFKAFSHERAVLRHNRLSPFKLFMPPYTDALQKRIRLLLKYL